MFIPFIHCTAIRISNVWYFIMRISDCITVTNDRTFFRFVIVHRRSLSFNSCYDTQVRSWCSLHIYIPHVHRSSIVWRSISRQRNGAILRGEQLSKMFMFIAHKLITILVNIHDVHCPISFHILVISYMRAATIEHDFIAFNQHL